MSTSSSHDTGAPRLFHRYELLEEIPHAAAGRLFRARDLAFQGSVSVKFFDANLRLDGEQRTALEEAVRHLQSRSHPNISRIHSVDTAGGLLIQEWVTGVSLLDLLRRRRSLPLTEVGGILDALPAALDFLAQEGLPTPPSLLGKLFVQFEESPPPDTVLAGPVAHWPPHLLKLHALSLRSWLTSSSIDDTTHFILPGAHQPGTALERCGSREFARLIYELLGGRIIELDAGRYSPIGALGESGNAILRQALMERPYASCGLLWRTLVEDRPELQREPWKDATSTSNHPQSIPAALLDQNAPGTILELIPVDRNATPIRLVARDRFTIGRSLQQADFAARILPENETNNALTNRLSRIHVALTRDAEGLGAWDGSGNGTSSLNGSRLKEYPLAADHPCRFADRSLLWLGTEYAMELIPVDVTPLLIANLESWTGSLADAASPAGETGALVCLPQGGQPVARHAAWLFTGAGFGLDASSDLVWDTRGTAPSPAEFHYAHAQFWLGNHHLPESVAACGDTALQRGEIAPLVPGQIVRLGTHQYKVFIE